MSSQLIVTPNWHDLSSQSPTECADDFYAALLKVHENLELEQSHALNARIILLLANHIGDLSVLQQALHLARKNLAS
ncbi:MAG: DUF2783 domain-containing protein [Gammaproteobacteria bacterium]|nr:DUF2783 domain-containing protein [Gammaproteobacteria bacterium]